MSADASRKTLYGGQTSNTCGFCAFHGKALTPKQMKKHKCLPKKCSALIRHEHPVWEQRAKTKELRKQRRERLEQAYIEAVGGGENAIHTEAVSAESTRVS